jgi:hypothetical protein
MEMGGRPDAWLLILDEVPDLSGYRACRCGVMYICARRPRCRSRCDSAGINVIRLNGADNNHRFDITADNIQFLHPELQGEEARGAVCVLDRYPDDQRPAMPPLVGDNNGLRTVEPKCGVLNYTVSGTLQGNWFNDVSQFTQGNMNVAFVCDEVLPGLPVIFIGYVPGIQSTAYRFAERDGGRVNLPFIEVEVGTGVYCYQDFKDDLGRPGPAHTCWWRCLRPTGCWSIPWMARLAATARGTSPPKLRSSFVSQGRLGTPCRRT